MCDHVPVTIVGIEMCSECGEKLCENGILDIDVKFRGFSDTSGISFSSSSKTHDIFSQLGGLELPETVLQKARSFYTNVQRIKNERTKKLYLFSCVYVSYKACCEKCNFMELLEHFDLQIIDGEQAIKQFITKLKNNNDVKNACIYLDPNDIIDYVCRRTIGVEYIDETTVIFQKVRKLSRVLNSSKAMNAVVACVLYMNNKYKLGVDIESLTNICGNKIRRSNLIRLGSCVQKSLETLIK